MNASDPKDQGIAVMLLQPGYVATEMVGGGGDIFSDAAAVQLANSLDSPTQGKAASTAASRVMRCPGSTQR